MINARVKLGTLMKLLLSPLGVPFAPPSPMFRGANLAATFKCEKILVFWSLFRQSPRNSFISLTLVLGDNAVTRH